MERDKIELHKILIDLLAPDYVDEALKILLISSDKWYNSFLEEINKKSYNTACIAIDFAYNDLVERGILIKSDDDKFGMDINFE
jgi:hypothetical protein